MKKKRKKANASLKLPRREYIPWKLFAPNDETTNDEGNEEKRKSRVRSFIISEILRLMTIYTGYVCVCVYIAQNIRQRRDERDLVSKSFVET